MTLDPDPLHVAEDAPPPRRIQRQRTKGWRMPEGAIYVGRPSRWGNPWRVGQRFGGMGTPPMDAVAVVAKFRRLWTLGHPEDQRAMLAPLRGHDLACWCPLDQPCHADVLLELANR